MKTWFKKTAVRLADRIGSQRFSPRTSVLCYHSVHPTKPFASVTPELFEAHLAWLSRNCDLVRFNDVVQRPSPWARRPRVAITFDDGYADNFDHAFPLLVKYSIPYTCFLTAGLLEKDRAVIDGFQALRGCDSEAIRPLTWDQVRTMVEHGGEFGSHTYSHPNLALLTKEAARRELRSSKDVIESHLGREVSLFAYPFGKPRQHFTRETIDIVGETGYRLAAAVLYRAVRPGESRYCVPRFCITRDDMESLRQKISGAWDVIGFWQTHVPVPVARIISPEHANAPRWSVSRT